MLSTHNHTATRARRATHPRVSIALEHAVALHGGDGLVAEVVEITPETAADWLKANRKNRPVRRKHVAFLAEEIVRGNWRLNGQAVVIAENEDILDGQHRLLAVIEAGIPIRTLVVYGISPEAFATMDTGAIRTGSDALYLHFNDMPVQIVKYAATAAQWCHRLERGNVRAFNRMSNTDVIAYVRKHASLFQCAETLNAYPKDARPLSIGTGTALYELFSRKAPDLAAVFMKSFYTGEDITRDDVEWWLRQAFIKDAQRSTKFPMTAKVRMVIKGWNWARRGMPNAHHNVIAIRTDDDTRIKIL